MDVDELYGLALERFVPERTALVKQLRADGRRDEAAKVGALRKPSVAAWAVNQLVRTQRQAMDELLAAGEALREAQSGVLSGRADARALREGTERERAAVEALADAARGLLSDTGHELSPATMDRVSETLHAAALDDDARERVTAGRLERELRHVGFGSGLGEGSGLGGQTRPRERAGERERAQARRQAQERKKAQAAEREAHRAVQRAERTVKSAQQRQERAAAAQRQATEELEQADAALAQARAEAQAAAGAHDEAKRGLTEA